MKKLISLFFFFSLFIPAACIGAEMDYQLVTNRQFDDIAKEGEIEIAPCMVVQEFGQPQYLSGQDIGTYCFVDAEGELFVLYNMSYDYPEEEIPALRIEFWAVSMPVPMSIGARESSDVGAFEVWLAKRLEGAGC